MLTAVYRQPWIVTCRRGAGTRLLCFSYAGGGPLIFRAWPQHLPADIEVCAVHLPGRESRLKEPPIGELRRLLDELMGGINAYLDRPIVLFGHSIGGLVAFEVARALRRHGVDPAHLVVSACPAPQVPNGEALSDLPEPAFLERMRRFNGTPQEVLEHPELMELVMPALRADFALRDHYTHEPGPPLTCPITAFGGMDDECVPWEQLDLWKTHTSEAFRLYLFQGGHFFIRTAQPAVVETVAALLRQP